MPPIHGIQNMNSSLAVRCLHDKIQSLEHVKNNPTNLMALYSAIPQRRLARHHIGEVQGARVLRQKTQSQEPTIVTSGS